MNKFYVIGMGNVKNTIIEIFKKVINGEVENAQYLQPYSFPNGLISMIYKIRYHKKFRKFFSWIPQKVWNRYYILEKLRLSNDDQHYILFMPGTDIDRLINPSYLGEFKEKHMDNVKLVLLLFDPVNSPLKDTGWEKITNIFGLFDLVATFEKDDAVKYGLYHFMDPYDRREIIEKDNVKSDLYFVGHDKGRLAFLEKITEHLVKNGVKSRILVANTSKNQSFKSNYITQIKKRISYDMMLAQMLNSNCLLEVLCEGQNSASLRYYEAIVYNKKLLTNNKNIFNMPFYNPKYMRYFEKETDIDPQWVKEKVEVDYGYHDEFSINSFFDKIQQATINNN